MGHDQSRYQATNNIFVKLKEQIKAKDNRRRSNYK